LPTYTPAQVDAGGPFGGGSTARSSTYDMRFPDVSNAMQPGVSRHRSASDLGAVVEGIFVMTVAARDAVLPGSSLKARTSSHAAAAAETAAVGTKCEKLPADYVLHYEPVAGRPHCTAQFVILSMFAAANAACLRKSPERAPPWLEP
jgi:hypothetical protein